MTDDPLETDQLFERLERYKAKQERGEELTDEEVEQLKQDIEEFNEAMKPVVETVAESMSDFVRNLNEALEPLVDAYEEMAEEDDGR